MDDGILESLLVNMQWKLDANMVRERSKPFSNHDMKKALFDMNLNKSLGFDGFPTSFYQRN